MVPDSPNVSFNLDNNNNVTIKLIKTQKNCHYLNIGLDGSPLPEAVKIDVCGDVEVCRLVRGTYAEMKLSIVAANDIVNPRARVIATAAGFTTPFPLPDDVANVCKNLDRGQCPIGVDEDFIFSMEMEINKEYPITPLVLEVSVVDEGIAGNPVISCFRLQAQTVDA